MEIDMKKKKHGAFGKKGTNRKKNKGKYGYHPSTSTQTLVI